MTVDRRTFLKTSGALAATGALPLALAAKPARKAKPTTQEAA